MMTITLWLCVVLVLLAWWLSPVHRFVLALMSLALGVLLSGVSWSGMLVLLLIGFMLYALQRPLMTGARGAALQAGLASFVAFFSVFVIQGVWPGLNVVPVEHEGDVFRWAGEPLGFYPAGMVLSLLFLSSLPLNPSRELAKSLQKGILWGLWVAIPVVLLPGMWAEGGGHRSNQPSLGEPFAESLAFVVLPILLIKSILDEAFFRGWMMGRLIPAMGPWTALTLSSLLYGMSYAFAGGAAILAGILTGVVLGMLYLRTGHRIETGIGANLMIHTGAVLSAMTWTV